MQCELVTKPPSILGCNFNERNVDKGGRCLLTIVLSPSDSPTVVDVEVWIDTGFTGELVMPQTVVNALGLTRSGSVDAVLADGSQTELTTYSCVIEWFGGKQNLEVIANDGKYPLLGVGLLLGLSCCSIGTAGNCFAERAASTLTCRNPRENTVSI